jgi:hypothetical protein
MAFAGKLYKRFPLLEMIIDGDFSSLNEGIRGQEFLFLQANIPFFSWESYAEP